MTDLRIAIHGNRTAFEPGEVLEGTVRWRLDPTETRCELRLFWFTRGKGSPDVEVVNSLVFDQPAEEETRPFRFTLPTEPYSVSGQLVSLVWALELIATPGKENTRLELVVAPHGREVLLHPV